MFQLILPLELKEELHKIIELAKSIENIDAQQLHNLVSRKLSVPIQVFLYKDELLAENLLNKIIKAFKNKK